MSVLGQLAKVAKAKPLRSTLDEAVEALARPKGTGAEYLKEIEKTKGVKPTEIKERGIDKVLANMPKVNKEEIVKDIQSKANPPIEEKILGSGNHKELDDMEKRHLKDMIDEHKNDELDPVHYNYMVDLLNRGDKSTNESLAQKVNDVDDRLREARANGQIRLARELSDEMDLLYDRQQRLDKVAEDNTQYGKYTLPNGQNYREVLLKLPKGEGNAFTSSHFPDKNILAHMRVSDRAGPNGEKVLHLEELQSDWHQKGRDKGYTNSEAEEKRKELSALALPYWKRGEQPPKEISEQLAMLPNNQAVPDAPFKKNWHEVALKKLINYATENGYDKIAITPGAEQASRYDLSKQINKLNYDELGDLRAFDKEGRMILSENVSPEKLPDYIGKDLGNKLAENQAKRLEAKKIYREALKSDAPNEEVDPLYKAYLSHPTEYSGLDLQVGGEGMKGFYDKMLPDYLNKLGKPHGAEVKMSDMPISTRDPNDRSWPANTPHPFIISSEAGEPIEGMVDLIQRHPDTGEESLVGRMLRADAEKHIASELQNLDKINQTKLHTFDLTPSLKNEVTQKGLPLYQQIGIPLGGAEAVNLAQPEPEMKRGGKVSISNNPDTMFMELSDRKFGLGGIVKALTPMEEAFAKMAKAKEAMKANAEMNRLYEEATKDMYTKDMPSFEAWKKTLPPPEVK